MPNNNCYQKCPKCGGGIGIIKEICPHCQHEFTEDDLNLFAKKQEKLKKGCTIGCLGILFLILAPALLVFFIEDESQAPLTLEHQLAIVNANQTVDETEPSIARFRYLLQQLESKTNLTQQQVGDMTLAAYELGREQHGITRMTFLEFMEQVNIAISESEYANADYAEVVTMIAIIAGSMEE